MNQILSQLSKLLLETVKDINSEEDIKKIESLLIKALNFDNRIYKDQVPYEVKVKLKSRPKRFRDIYPGQIFEIYLMEIDKFAYGVVLEGNLKLDKYNDIIIAYLNCFSSTPLPVENIFKNIEERNFCFIANSGIASIINYRWTYVCNYEEIILDKNELNNVEYAIKFMGKCYKSVGNSMLPVGDCEKISEEEYMKIPNTLGIDGDLSIEDRLVTLAKTQF